MKTLEEIKRIITEHHAELSAKYKIKYLGVFGSYARGEQDNRSDLDLLVEFKDNALIGLEFFELESYLSDILGVQVDLVTRAALKPRIGKRILSEVVYL